MQLLGCQADEVLQCHISARRKTPLPIAERLATDARRATSGLDILGCLPGPKQQPRYDTVARGNQVCFLSMHPIMHPLTRIVKVRHILDEYEFRNLRQFRLDTC